MATTRYLALDLVLKAHNANLSCLTPVPKWLQNYLIAEYDD